MSVQEIACTWTDVLHVRFISRWWVGSSAPRWLNHLSGTSLRCIDPCSLALTSSCPCHSWAPLSTFLSHSLEPCYNAWKCREKSEDLNYKNIYFYHFTTEFKSHLRWEIINYVKKNNCTVKYNYNQIWKICMKSESDIRPSMVTHTRNLCSAFDPSKVHTHGAVGSHLCCGARGAVRGSVPCSRVSPQSWYWRWRECCTFTPPTYNSCRPETRTHNLSITSPTL